MKEKKKFLGQIPFFLFSVRGTFFCPYSNFSTMVISSTRRCGMSACQGGTGAWRHNPWVDRSIPIIESIALRITLTEFRFSGQAKLRLTWSRHANRTAWGYWDNDIKSSRQTWCASRKKTKISLVCRAYLVLRVDPVQTIRVVPGPCSYMGLTKLIRTPWLFIFNLLNFANAPYTLEAISFENSRFKKYFLP